jgi:5'-methylthioadenosine phosphorylase
MIKIGIIGGSGLDDPKILDDFSEKQVTTEYGSPSSTLSIGKISGVDDVILARHG